MEEFINKIKKALDDYQKSLEIFYHASDNALLNSDKIRTIQNEFGIASDIPIIFSGLTYYLSSEEPLYYFKKDVMDEIFNQLLKWAENNETDFIDGFINSQEAFFAAVNSYLNIADLFREFGDLSYEIEIKTKIFRNPMYVQICEDCLMNFYRCLRTILNGFCDKDYSSQDTLGQVIPILSKHNFENSIKVDINLRNAINHGNTLISENKISFKYKESGRHKVAMKDIWQYDDAINDLLDIAGGILAGFIKFFVVKSHLLPKLLISEIAENERFEWFKLFYLTTNTRVLFISQAELKKTQINATLQTSIDDKNKLLLALIEIAKGLFFHFPTYEKYFVGYKHNRSINGFISFNLEDFDILTNSNEENAKLLERAIKRQECLVWDIMADDVDERAYKFHVFPKIRGESWHLSRIEDCSSNKSKRIKANLIIEENLSVKQIKEAIKYAVELISEIKTPKSPHINQPYGDTPADAIFLNIFFKNKDRKGFTLLLNNHNFICVAHYYRDRYVVRLEHGGVPKVLWQKYRKEETDNIQIGWNPNFKAKNSG